ncbi:MAG: hypothetical protein JKY08_08720 [Flavobacteriaceae bacterium]|nr:hypothetical protein [Flavobacteriaceae bacterium]
MNNDSISKINEIISKYFEEHDTDWIPAKDLMPALIQGGIFNKDNKKGLPLRKLLRSLDKNNTLDQIPCVHAERNEKTIYWYIVKEGAAYTPTNAIPTITNRQKALNAIENSDETFVLNLCDEILNQTAVRKFTFDFLLGDMHKNSKSRTKLPIDAYYKELKLAIEFEGYFKEEVAKEGFLDSTRASKIDIYKQRKKDYLEKKEIKLITINYKSFDCDENGAIDREATNIPLILNGKLRDFKS